MQKNCAKVSNRFNQPAGASSVYTRSASGKKKAGENVAAFIKREGEISRALENHKNNAKQSYKASWEEKQTRKIGQYGRAKINSQAEEDLDIANKELQILRHERLKSYYARCYVEWESELNSKGLALVKDRD